MLDGSDTQTDEQKPCPVHGFFCLGFDLGSQVWSKGMTDEEPLPGEDAQKFHDRMAVGYDPRGRRRGSDLI